MSIKRAVLAAVTFMLVLGIPTIALAAQRTFSGNVEYNEVQPLPADAELWIRLDDVTTNTIVVDFESKGLVKGKVFSYTINVDSSLAPADHKYRVIAEIGNANQARLKRGVTLPFSGTSVPTIQVTMSSGRIGDPGSGAERLLLALLMVVLAGIIALWRRSRTRPLAGKL